MKSPTTEAGHTPTPNDFTVCREGAVIYCLTPNPKEHSKLKELNLFSLSVCNDNGLLSQDQREAFAAAIETRLNSHTRLESDVEALREALQDLDAAFVLFLHERDLTVRADETIVRDAIKRACDLLAQSTPKPAQGTEGNLP